MKVAIIPARGGSKRIPKKNIKYFCGKPMIAWSISAALDSGLFDRVIVSTDDEEISEVARKYGAEVPIMRPASLSDDYATTLDVISHVVQELNNLNQAPEFVCCLYATAPLVNIGDLRGSHKMLIENEVDYVFSATSFSFPIQRAFKVFPNNSVEMFQPDQFNTRSQDLEEAFHDAGQFYWGRAKAFLEKKPIFTKMSRAYLLPRSRVKDIDTPEDWHEAELMFEILKAKRSLDENSV